MRKLAKVPIKPSSHPAQNLSLTFSFPQVRHVTKLKNVNFISRLHSIAHPLFTKRRIVVRVSRFILLFTLLCLSVYAILWGNLQAYFIHEDSVDLQPAQVILPESVHTVPETLAKYIEWHRVQRACIKDPSSCQQPFERPSVLIWRCPDRKVRICAGIGDRVRGMQVALMIAILSRRLFFIQWPAEEFPLYNAVTPNVIDWRVPPTITYDASVTHAPMLNWFICNYPQRRTRCRPPGFLVPKDEYLPNLELSLPTLNAFSDDIVGNLSVATDITMACRLHVSTIDALLENTFIAPTVPDLQQKVLPSLQLQRLLTAILFRPSNTTTAVMSRIVTSDFSGPHGYIGAHGRTGVAFREVGDRFSFYRQNMTAAVSHLLTCVQHVVVNPLTNVFLSSDSATFKREFAAQAKSLNVNVRFIDADAFHFGLGNSNKLLAEQGQLARYNAFIDIFADLFMLAGAKQIITTGSGFADFAFWLGNASQLIIAPPGRGTAICNAARDQTQQNLSQPVILKQRSL